MFGWLLEVVNSGVSSDIISSGSEPFATITAEPNAKIMFLFGILVGIIISIIAGIIFYCITSKNDNEEHK